MNILIINFEYPPLGGGGGVATKQLAEELAKRHTVHVITTGYKHLPSTETIQGVHVYRVPVIGRTSLPTASLISMATFVPMALWKGFMLLKNMSCTVINAQFVIPSGIPAAILSRIFHIPFVVSFIGGDIYDPTKGTSPHRHPFLRFCIRFITAQARLCTAISEDTKKRAATLHGITKEIVVTHLGLVPLEVPPATREELGLPSSGVLAVSIGRLIPRKSYTVLLEAWQKLSGSSQLFILGDGPLKEQLQQWINDHVLHERVHLLGFVDEIKKLQLLRACDMYVSAAEHEGFGIVFLEAMDAGLPIIAVNEGGQTDFLQDKENALLVPPHQPSAITKAVEDLLENSSLRESMGLANKKKAPQFYLERTAAVFESVLRRATTNI